MACYTAPKYQPKTKHPNTSRKKGLVSSSNCTCGALFPRQLCFGAMLMHSSSAHSPVDAACTTSAALHLKMKKGLLVSAITPVRLCSPDSSAFLLMHSSSAHSPVDAACTTSAALQPKKKKGLVSSSNCTCGTLFRRQLCFGAMLMHSSSAHSPVDAACTTSAALHLKMKKGLLVSAITPVRLCSPDSSAFLQC